MLNRIIEHYATALIFTESTDDWHEALVYDSVSHTHTTDPLMCPVCVCVLSYCENTIIIIVIATMRALMNSVSTLRTARRQRPNNERLTINGRVHPSGFHCSCETSMRSNRLMAIYVSML